MYWSTVPMPKAGSVVIPTVVEGVAIGSVPVRCTYERVDEVGMVVFLLFPLVRVRKSRSVVRTKRRKKVIVNRARTRKI